jgi:uncharacterized protein YuzE
MKTTYYPEDDILVVRLSDALPVREVSQSWNTHVSYGADGEVVEVVILEAKEKGLYPPEIGTRAA